MAQLVKCWSCKHGTWISSPEPVYHPSTGQWRRADRWGFLDNQPSLMNKLRASKRSHLQNQAGWYLGNDSQDCLLVCMHAHMHIHAHFQVYFHTHTSIHHAYTHMYTKEQQQNMIRRTNVLPGDASLCEVGKAESGEVGRAVACTGDCVFERAKLMK